MKEMKKSRIEIRVTKRQKNKILKLASEDNMFVSEFLLYSVLSNKKKEIPFDVFKMEALLEEACNHLKENYGGDAYLEELRNQLWEI